jgi:hypothetical protein
LFKLLIILKQIIKGVKIYRVIERIHLIFPYFVLKIKKSHNIICNENHYAQAYTNKVNMTRALLQTTGGKDQPNIVLYGNRPEHHGNIV